MVKVRRSKNTWYEYLFLIFLILWSGGGFTYGIFPRWMFIACPINFLIFYLHGYKIRKYEVILICSVYLVLLLQMLKFGGALITTFTPICAIVTCMFFARLIAPKFSCIFVDIIYKLSYITLILWVVTLFPWGVSLLRSVATSLPQLGWENFTYTTNVVDTLYVFSVPKDVSGVIRNSGPFWEPGRFTIFITIALAINIFKHRESMFSKRNIVLLLTNITTFSTTGYVAMGVLIIGYAILGRLKLTYKFFIVFILAILIPFVVQLDFISAKIIQQSGELDVTWSRFGALYYHWSQIVKSPIIGYGPFLANASSELLLSPNGITDIIRYYGFPLSTVFYIMLYKGTRLYIGTSNPKINICCFIVIITLCFSQTITLSPFFYLLYFLAFNNTELCHQK